MLRKLNEIDHRLSALGESAMGTIGRVEKLFAGTPVIEISDAVKLRAAQRAIDKRAPFHRQRNCIDDAILIEIYAEAVATRAAAGTRFAFVTHNTKDFSHPQDSNKLPHPDVAACFSRKRSLYFTTLGAALRRVQPAEFADLMIEEEWVEEPRKLAEILEAIDELCTKIWYNRQQVWREKIGMGKIRIVDKEISLSPLLNTNGRQARRINAFRNEPERFEQAANRGGASKLKDLENGRRKATNCRVLPHELGAGICRLRPRVSSKSRHFVLPHRQRQRT